MGFRHAARLNVDTKSLAGASADDPTRTITDKQLWLCEAEADLPTAADGVEQYDWAFAFTEGTTWKRGVASWTQITGGSGAPTNVDYLVGTADGTLSAEIVVGTSPGGELGGSWAAPTVDATHSGSAHHSQTHDHTGAEGAVVTGGITNAAVTYAKIQDVSAASRLLGRGSAAGAGDVEEITLGSGITMSGTTLSSSAAAPAYAAIAKWGVD